MASKGDRASGQEILAASATDWERGFWLLFRRSSSPISLLDADARFVDVNDAFLAWVRMGRLELLGTSMLELIRPSERERAMRKWEAFMARGGEYGDTRHLLFEERKRESKIEFAARTINTEARKLAVYVVISRSDVSLEGGSSSPKGSSLTRREREVVTLIALGRDTVAIAAELFISPETVRTHVRNAMAKLGARTRAQLVAAALCNDSAINARLLEGQEAD